MDRWLQILGIVVPLLAAAATAVWRRNDKALLAAEAENVSLKEDRIKTRIETLERRGEEHHADCVERFDRADAQSSKLASMVQGLADLRPRVEALERRR